MRRSTATTLKDVASEAGVSIMAASVVLNGATSSTRVSASTKSRILEAAKRLRYVRNAAAVGLSRSRMNTIGVVSTLDTKETNLYFLEIINGIVSACAERDQTTKVFAVANWHADEARILQFCDGRIDGLILISPDLTLPFGRTLAQASPFVTIHSNDPAQPEWNLDIDGDASGYMATRYLIERGHRRILHLTGTLNLIGARLRVQGYRRALAEAGIPDDGSLIVQSEYSIEAGRRSTSAYIQELDSNPLPTAIFCASDAIAYGCMEILADHGLTTPDDISVIGFDDTFIARTTKPPLTTMRHPFRDMGRRAVDLLLAEIQHDISSDEAYGDGVAHAAGGPRVELFDVTLVERESVGPPIRP